MKVELATAQLRSLAGNQAVLELEGGSIKQLLDDLVRRYPGFAGEIKKGVAVSIDGRIFQENWGTAIPENAELVILPYIHGG